MIDWITHVWTRPLGSWSFLDLAGVAAVLIVGFTLAVFAGIFAWAAIESAREEIRAKKGGPLWVQLLIYAAIFALVVWLKSDH